MQTANLRIPTSSEVGSWCSSLQKDLLSSTFRILRIPASSEVGSWCSSLQKICFHQRFAFFAYPPRQRWVGAVVALNRQCIGSRWSDRIQHQRPTSHEVGIQICYYAMSFLNCRLMS